MIVYKKPRHFRNLHPFSVAAVTVDLLSTLPDGKLSQEGRLKMKPMDDFFYEGMAIFAVVDNEWTPLELHHLMNELNGYYLWKNEDPEVYEKMCGEYDPRVIRGYRLKLCGGPWVRFTPEM